MDDDLDLVVSEIGLTANWSASFTPNAGPMDAVVKVQLKAHRSKSAQEYVALLRKGFADDAQFNDLEISFDAGIVGQHVTAGQLIAHADLLGNGQSPAPSWQYSSNFDIAVFNGDDTNTINYFAALSADAFGVWAARGVTSVAQTLNPGNPTCAAFNSYIGQPDIVAFTPPL